MARTKNSSVGISMNSPWHVRAKDVAILHMIAGDQEIRKIMPNGFSAVRSIVYNDERVAYDIIFKLHRENSEPHIDHILSYEFLFEHIEPANKFPSEELKTKILLVAG